MRKTFTTNRAFTLIELLTVIAIIGVLVALLFPAIKSSMLKAETSKAQAAISSGLATAFKSYYTEYGKWPIAYSIVNPPYEDFVVDKAMVALLSGDDVGGTSITYPGPTVYHPYVDTAFGPPYAQSGNAIIQGNPRKIVFLEFKTKDIDTSAATSGYFLDPWGRHYHFRLDVNYANVVNYPFAVQLPQTLITTGFLIWSVGPDGQYDQIDVVVSPSPLVVTSSQKNKDNVKSW